MLNKINPKSTWGPIDIDIDTGTLEAWKPLDPSADESPCLAVGRDALTDIAPEEDDNTSE